MRKIILGLIIAICLLPIIKAQSTIVLLRGMNHYQGLSTDTKSTTGIIKGSTFYETDTGRSLVYDGSAWRFRFTDIAATRDTLTNQDSISVHHSVKGFNLAGFMYEVRSIAGTAYLFMEGKTGTGNWTNVDNEGDSLTHTADGHYGVNYNKCALLDSTRLRLSTFSAGDSLFIEFKRGE